MMSVSPSHDREGGDTAVCTARETEQVCARSARRIDACSPGRSGDVCDNINVTGIVGDMFSVSTYTPLQCPVQPQAQARTLEPRKGHTQAKFYKNSFCVELGLP